MSTRQVHEGSRSREHAAKANVVTPDDFVLGSDDEQVSVSYSTYGVTPPTLTYHNERDATGVGTYTGEKLHAAQSELGDLITVTLEEIPDAHRRTLTLLVPAIYLDPDAAANGIAVETLVIWSTSREGREARGQIQTYEELQVSGTAKRSGF